MDANIVEEKVEVAPAIASDTDPMVPLTVTEFYQTADDLGAVDEKEQHLTYALSAI